MKAIIGIDSEEAYKNSLVLFKRLNFDKPDITLVHAVSPFLPYGSIGFGASMPPIPDATPQVEKAALEALEAASDFACRLNLKTETKVSMGCAAQCLIEEADAQGGDLLVVRASRKTALGSMFLGSASRALVIAANCSSLIVKDVPPTSGPVDVVIGTDLSPYAAKCVDEFINWEPKGIGTVSLVVAYEVNADEAALLHANLPHLGGQVNLFIEEKLREQAQDSLDRLSAAGYRTQLIVDQGEPNEVLRNAMTKTKSELMVIGARGHGLLERLMIGSVSLHQVIAEPYSVLVVRV